jgi:hypothetical protein
MKKRTLIKTAIWLTILCAVAIRLWAAWAYRYDLNYDRARAMLMTRHMMDNHPFPVFSYGATHLGSLEPAVSALICKLAGFNTFTANLGTVLLSVLLLILVYHWTCAASDRRGGLLALIFLLIGPFGFFVFTVLPRGGYAATMLLAVALLFLTGRMVMQNRQQGNVPTGMFWLLGLLGGLAWWTNQMLTAALLTSALWITGSLRTKVFTRKTAGMIVLFFVASAPWWIWNFYHGWESLAFIPSIYGPPLLHGLKLFFWDRLFNLINLPSAWGTARFIIPLVYAGLVFYSLIFTAVHLRRHRNTTNWIIPGIALSFLAIYAVLFAKSVFALQHSARYLIPVIPVLALLIGISTSDLFKRFRYGGLCLIAFALLCAAQFSAFITEQTADTDEKPWQQARELAAFCARQGIEVVFVDQRKNWMNIATDEPVVFCDFSQEAYAPYEKAGNQTDSPALLNNAFDMTRFLKGTQADCSIGTAGTWQVYYNFTNAPIPAQPLEPENYEAIIAGTAQSNIAHLVTDHDCDTIWKAVVHSKGPPVVIHLRLNQPQVLNGIRLWCSKERYPVSCRLEGRTDSNSEWITLLPDMPAGPLFWSGPRWYINGLFYRMMYRFPETQALRECRLTFLPCARYDYQVDLTELQLLGKRDKLAPESWSRFLPDLCARLQQRNIMRCFADRWLSAKLYDTTTGAVEVIMPSFMPRTIYSAKQEIRKEYHDILRLTPNDAMVVPAAEAPALERTLNKHNITMRKTPIGPWILFDFSTGQYTRNSAIFPGLKWVGFGCFDNSEVNRKRKGDYYYREARYAVETEKKLANFKQAIELYPRHKSALRDMVSLAERLDNKPLTQIYRRALQAFTPAIETPIRYENGIQLLGITPRTMQAAAGGELAFDIYWECPPDVNPAIYAVFIHITQNGERFQGDHVLLDIVPEEEITQQTTAETFIDPRTIPVPIGTSLGTYRITIGVYNRITGFRLHPETPLKTHRNGVILPLPITVTAPRKSTGQK